MGNDHSATECDEDGHSEMEIDTPKPSGKFESLSARQIRNRTGAYVWEVNDMMKLQRFLFLSSEMAFTYKAGEDELRREDAQCIDRLISDGKGKEVVALIREISLAGRAPKQHPSMFALAVCARSQDPETKKAAYEILNEVCRYPTHLFLFITYCEQMSSGTGWGRAHKRAINNWYEFRARNPKALAKVVTKCKSAEKWSHKDVFRLSHPKPNSKSGSLALDIIVRFVINGIDEAEKFLKEKGTPNEEINDMMNYLKATEKARRCTDEDEMSRLITQYGLQREQIPTQLLNSPEVWKALIGTIKMTAKIRNLGKITNLDLCKEGSTVEQDICLNLTNEKELKDARVHPFHVLVALSVYRRGKGDRGKLEWLPNENIVKALNKAFYLSFQAVEPTGKRYMLAIDVSGSMNVPCVGSQAVTCREAAAAMMMVTARTESNYDVVAFSQRLTPMNIDRNDKLDDVFNKFNTIGFGQTDCALPMVWAKEQKKEYDVFVVYTDIETWYDKVHPARALQEYRNHMKIHDAKLVVVGLASHGFTVADPDDFGMLDVVGFDFGAIVTMQKFIAGTI